MKIPAERAVNMFYLVLALVLLACGCIDTQPKGPQPGEVVNAETTPTGSEAGSAPFAPLDTMFVYDSADTFSCYRIITDGGWIVDERRWPKMDGRATGDDAGDLRAAATAGLKALAAMTPLEAASALNAAGWDCLSYPEVRHRWEWAEAPDGSPAVRYEVEYTGTAFVDQRAYEMWMRAPYAYSVRVRGIDADGRVGPWSTPGETEER